MKNKYVKTFEAGCKIIGIDTKLPDVSWMPEDRAKGVVGIYKLDVIAEAQNKGAMPDGSDFIPDFSNSGQRKYFPVAWYNPSLGRFVSPNTYCTSTLTLLGARFYFPDDETAEAMGKLHVGLLGDLAPQVKK